jgi:hypothetical protein
MRTDLLIYDEMLKYLTIYEEAVNHIRLCNRSLLNFLIYEENSIFFFISAYSTRNIHLFLICYLRIKYDQLFVITVPSFCAAICNLPVPGPAVPGGLLPRAVRPRGHAHGAAARLDTGLHPTLHPRLNGMLLSVQLCLYYVSQGPEKSHIHRTPGRPGSPPG